LRSFLPKLGLWAAMTLALAASALPAAAFIGNFRGPKVDGELALPGLSAPVRETRDEHGIPYIFAANTPDLIRAQGFVTAQNRLFQLEGARAVATGRLAEAVGEAGLASDRQMRLLGLRRNAERHAGLLSPEARDFLTWYAEGLSAYITGHADDHPVELKLAKQVIQQPLQRFCGVALSLITAAQGEPNLRLKVIFFEDAEGDIPDHLAPHLQLQRQLAPFAGNAHRPAAHLHAEQPRRFQGVRRLPALVLRYQRIGAVGGKGFRVR